MSDTAAYSARRSELNDTRPRPIDREEPKATIACVSYTILFFSLSDELDS
jgi:hypothetical protein